VDSVPVVSIARLKGARARVVLSDEAANENKPASVTPVPQSSDQATSPVVPTRSEEDTRPLVSRLLDARKKRSE